MLDYSGFPASFRPFPYLWNAPVIYLVIYLGGKQLISLIVNRSKWNMLENIA